MHKYKKIVIGFTLLTFITAVSLPLMPVYASIPGEIVGQNTASTSAGNGLFETIITVLLGDILTKLFHILPGTSDNIASSTANAGLKGNTITDTKDVAGFFTEWWDGDKTSYTDTANNVGTLKTIIPFWATLHPDGSLTDRGGKDHAEVVKFAHQHNMTALLMVNNSNQGNANWSVHNVLSSPDLRSQSIDNLESILKNYGLDGINIDFETVPGEDRDNLTAFMQELARRLKPEGYIVSIDVFPKSDESNDVAMAYDYAALAKYTDRIMIMAYDEHGDWSGPGPIADIGWVEKNLEYALKFIPKNKLDLCVAGYGYDWSSKGVVSVDAQQAIDLAQQYSATITWDDDAKAPYFNYTDSEGVYHTVWFENSESLKFKLDLVNKYDIAGVSLWKLGGEDPTDWHVLHDKLIKPKYLPNK